MPITQASLSDINPSDLLTLAAQIQIGNGRTAATTTHWVPLGSAMSVQYNPGATHKQRQAMVRGHKRTVGASTTARDPKYIVTANEQTSKIIDMIYFVDEAKPTGSNAQSALSAVVGKPFDFDTGADGIAVKKGYRSDILSAAGVQIMAIAAITLVGTEAVYGAAADSTTLVEGIDYELDGDIGQIRWLRDIDDDVITPTITAEAIAPGDANYMVSRIPNRAGFVEKLTRIYWYDEDSQSDWALWHKDFLARYLVTGGHTANAEADAEAALEIQILTDGTLYKRTRS